MADIHRASKDGQLYDIGGGAKSYTAQAEPAEPTEYDIRPASQVYSVSAVLASTANLGSGKAPLPFALSQGTASYLCLALLSWPQGTPGQALSCPALPGVLLQLHSLTPSGVVPGFSLPHS